MTVRSFISMQFWEEEYMKQMKRGEKRRVFLPFEISYKKILLLSLKLILILISLISLISLNFV